MNCMTPLKEPRPSARPALPVSGPLAACMPCLTISTRCERMPIPRSTHMPTAISEIMGEGH
jgi:hypothetical protein